jgi:hypothetical protein
VTAERVEVDGFRGEAAASLAAAGLPALRRLVDPAAALETVHWGRNYLYRARVDAPDGALDVVVKQFRERSWRARQARRRSGSKAERSFRGAQALVALGVATPEPLLWLDSEAAATSLYVCRHLPGRVEARYLVRARNAGREPSEFPGVDWEAFLAAAASLARRLHDGGVWHRDFSAGNLLILPGARPDQIAEIALVDLNRLRRRARVTIGERMRDLARLPLEREEDRAQLLTRYFGIAGVPVGAWLRYDLARVGFHGRHRVKSRVRAAGARLKSWLVPRGAHAHIPPPAADATGREKIVWDRLSDQPHSHAGRLERAWIRLADGGDHLKSFAAAAGAVPRIRARYRELVAQRNHSPFAWPGAGVALRPWPRAPEALLESFFELGLKQALVRLHPWSTDARERDDEQELARALAAAGVELAFALPQTRELVRDPARWRAAIEEIAERFTPFGQTFQVGQAINRSKWGVWSYGEYLELAAAAAAILRRHPGVELVGPGVIDFEAHATAAVVNRRHPTLAFDALSSLLYVDRRGAPENRQLGFDTADKATLLTAIAESSRLVGRRRHWITEVNWPLAEGPHSPAGRSVAVDEERQADYLARYYLLALGTGYVERVFWWQLVAKGYGLVDPGDDGALRPRPAYRALAALERALPPGTTAHGPHAPKVPSASSRSSSDARLYRFTLAGGGQAIAGWSIAGRVVVELPFVPRAALDRDGAPLAPPAGARVELGSGVRYFFE